MTCNACPDECTGDHPDERPTCAECKEPLAEDERDYCVKCEPEFVTDVTRPMPTLTDAQLIQLQGRVA